MTALGAASAFNFQEAADHALDRAPLAMSVMDVSGRCLWANAAFERVAGYQPDELVGRYLSDLTFPQDADDDEHLLREPAPAHIPASQPLHPLPPPHPTLT